MKHLIVYCHPNPNSFCNAIKDAVITHIREKGGEYTVRDLYAIGFDPVLNSSDFEALKRGEVPQDIHTEQAYISQADTITFIYPIWWTGMPAIVKGYIDRVLNHGFAYTFNDKGPIGLLKDKKVSIFNTHGLPGNHYDTIGMYLSMNMTTDAGIFQFCGLEVINHKYFASVPFISVAERENMLEEVKMIVENIY